MRVDYATGKTYEHLWKEVFVHGFTKEGCLGSLLSCHPELPVTLPSWIYDCDSVNSNVTAYELGFSSSIYHASGKYLAEVQVTSQDEWALSFKTVQIGKAEALTALHLYAKTARERFQASEEEFSARIDYVVGDIVRMVKD